MNESYIRLPTLPSPEKVRRGLVLKAIRIALNVKQIDVCYHMGWGHEERPHSNAVGRQERADNWSHSKRPEQLMEHYERLAGKDWDLVLKAAEAMADVWEVRGQSYMEKSVK